MKEIVIRQDCTGKTTTAASFFIKILKERPLQIAAAVSFYQETTSCSSKNPPEGHKFITHPIAGEMIFEYQALQAVDSPNLQVVINTPVTNTETENKVKMLINKYAAEDLLSK